MDGEVVWAGFETAYVENIKTVINASSNKIKRSPDAFFRIKKEMREDRESHLALGNCT